LRASWSFGVIFRQNCDSIIYPDNVITVPINLQIIVPIKDSVYLNILPSKHFWIGSAAIIVIVNAFMWALYYIHFSQKSEFMQNEQSNIMAQ